MRIGINLAVLHNLRTGVGHYTASLVAALLRCAPEMEWRLLASSPQLREEFEGPNVRHVDGPILRGAARIAWEHTGLVRQAVTERLDVLHCPDFSRPLWAPCPVISTIHDLSYWQAGAWYPALRRYYKRGLTRWSLGQSAALIAVSRFTRQEIETRFGTAVAAGVHVIHNGGPIVNAGRAEPATPPYLLCVGTLEARKNLLVLLRSFAQLRSATCPNLHLHLVGRPGHGWSDIAAALENHVARAAITVHSYVDAGELARLYSGAMAVVHPSCYEGFGFPVLEAMALGVPVVCARAASLPEIAGTAALYFEPTDSSALTATLTQVLHDVALRTRLASDGQKRARLFTWEACAHAHLAVYRFVHNSQRQPLPGNQHAYAHGIV